MLAQVIVCGKPTHRRYFMESQIIDPHEPSNVGKPHTRADALCVYYYLLAVSRVKEPHALSVVAVREIVIVLLFANPHKHLQTDANKHVKRES